MLGMLLSILSGALMSIQGVFNTGVTKQSSIWVASGFVQFSALLVCVAAWFFTGRESISALWQTSNKYTLLGGVIGTFITITVIQSMSALGPGKAAMLIVISQLIVAYGIELLGIFGVDKQSFELRKVIGLAIAMIGGLLMSRLTKLVKLPAVTAYLVAGLILGPFCIGALNFKGIGFSSFESVEITK